MAELATIARPYAEAVFRLAKQGNALPAWSDALNLIATVYQDPQMQAVMANPKVTSADIERLLLAICGERIDGVARNLIQLLVHNRRLSVLAEIRELFEQLKLEDEGKVDAKISSAFPMDDAQRYRGREPAVLAVQAQDQRHRDRGPRPDRGNQGRGG